jgi:hypothetical protein
VPSDLLIFSSLDAVSLFQSRDEPEIDFKHNRERDNDLGQPPLLNFLNYLVSLPLLSYQYSGQRNYQAALK